MVDPLDRRHGQSKTPERSQQERDEERLLEEGLEETFPASDAVQIVQPKRKKAPPNPPRRD